MTLGAFLLKASPLMVGLTVFAGIFNGLCSVAFLAVINSRLHHHAGFPTVLALGFLGLMLAKLASSGWSQILLVRFAQDTLLALTDRLCRSVVRAPFRQLECIGIPRILTILTDDVSTLSYAILTLPSLVTTRCYPRWVCGSIWLGFRGPPSSEYLGLVVVGGVTYRLFLTKARLDFRRARDGRDTLFRHFRALTEGIKELQLHRGRREVFFSARSPPPSINCAATILRPTGGTSGRIAAVTRSSIS